MTVLGWVLLIKFACVLGFLTAVLVQMRLEERKLRRRLREDELVAWLNSIPVLPFDPEVKA